MPAEKERGLNEVINIMPNSVEAEQDILFCILRNQAMQLEILSRLAVDDFYQANHAIIFEAMREIAGGFSKIGDGKVVKTIDFVSLVDCLRRNGKLAQVGDIDYILRLNEKSLVSVEK